MNSGKSQSSECRLFSEGSRAQYQEFRLEVPEGRTSATNNAKVIAANPLWDATASFQEDASCMIIMVDLLDCVMHAPLSVQQWETLFLPFLGYAVMMSNACSVLAPKEHASPFCSSQVPMCSLTSICPTCTSAPAWRMLILLLIPASVKPETSKCQATT